MEKNKIQMNIVSGEIVINDNWVLTDDSYNLSIQEDGLKGWFTIESKEPVFERTEVVTIKPVNTQAVKIPALTKSVSCEILGFIKSDNGWTYEIYFSK